MASRDITNFRGSIDQVPVQTGQEQTGQFSQALAAVGQHIIEENQQARITENFSKAQLDLSKLEQEYQLNFENDPFGGLDGLAEKRKEILTSYEDQISPFFRRDWQENARQLETKQDATLEAWAYKQTKVNTVRSINESIKTNMFQASSDGKLYGASESDDLASALNFKVSRDKLAAFGSQHLGEGSTKDLLESYNDDYLKSFISGVSDSNPLKALRMLDDENIKKNFKDPAQYEKMREAVESRALHVQEINGQKEVLSTLKDENSLLTRSLEEPLSYADLQSEFSRVKMSPAAQSFFMKANGYTKADGTKNLDPAQQMQEKAQMYEDITALVAKPDLATSDIAAFQERIYAGMNNKTLSEKEGMTFLSQLVSPLVDQKEESFKNFSNNALIAPDVGFKGVQQMFEKELAVPTVKDPTNEEGRAAKLQADTLNNANKVKLYDYYMTALEANASSYGVKIGDVPKLDKVQQRKLYSEAQAEAKRLYMLDKNPALSTLNDMPNQIFAGGKLIQGAAGNRDLKPDVSANPGFELQVGSDGYLYRLYPDGNRERAGKAPEGMGY